MTTTIRRRLAAGALSFGLALTGMALAGPTVSAGQRTQTTAPAGSVAVTTNAIVYPVTVRTDTYVDTKRKTSANGTFPGLRQRTLPTLIIEPQPAERGQRFPLLVFGHGLGAEPADYQALLTEIAGRGFVVAAPTFPLTNKRTPGRPNLLDQPNQPADVRFVIDQLLRSDNVSSPLVDRTRIAVAGHSLGAITVVDLIGNPCCYDKRIKAAVSVAGTLNVFRSGKLFSTPATPALFIHGDRDGTVPYGLGYSTYQAVKAPKYFVTVLGGGHSFDLAGVPNSRQTVGPVIADAVVSFLDAQLNGAQAPKAALQAEVAAHPTLLRYEAVG